MNLKSKNLFKLFLIFSLVVIFSTFFSTVVFAKENIIRTSSSETICSDGKCKTILYSRNVFDYYNGSWLPISDVIGFNWTGNEFKLYYKNNPNIYIDIQPFINYQNGNNYTFQNIKKMFPSSILKDKIHIEKFNYKFSLNLSIPKNLIDNINYIGFRVVNVSGLDKNDIVRYKNSLIIKNKYELDFSDVLRNNFTLSKVGKELRISNLKANYKNGVLFIDPIVTLQTADKYNLEDTYIHTSSIKGNETSLLVGRSADGSLY